MAGFSWMLLTVVCCSQQFLLHAGNSYVGVNQNRLANIVDQIWENYRGKKMFSMAVSIPLKENTKQVYDVGQVLSVENGNEVKAVMNKGDVFMKDRIVAAQVKRAKPNIHAEYRVLQNLDVLLNKNFDYDNDLLVVYVLGSPCYQRCTNEAHLDNIIQYLDKIKSWKHYAFVFTHVHKSRNPDQETNEEQLREALENLGIKSGLGLRNIFRCEKSDDSMECTSCSHNNHVAKYCVSEEHDNSPILPSSSIMNPQQGRSESPSHTASRTRVPSVVRGAGGGGNVGSEIQVASGSKKKTNRKKRANNGGTDLPSQGSVMANPGGNTVRGPGGAGRGKVRKVGNRRIGAKRGGVKNKQKGGQTQTKKPTKKNERSSPGGGTAGGSKKEQVRSAGQGKGGKIYSQPPRPKSMQEINQPQRGKSQKKTKRSKQKRG